MRNITFEQILLVIIFILAPLMSFILQRVNGRLANQLPRQEPEEPMRRQSRVVLTAAPPAAPSLASTRAPRARVPTISVSRSQRRFSKTSLLGSPRDLRRGIVIMTILGPCRANEPPE
ncbi:MAG: hypothetical protein WD688_17880 [Candidatus Binatia bacterium]